MRVNIRALVDAGRRLAEGYRPLFGIGAVAVVLAQTVLTPNVTGWAEPWLGSLALTVGVLGVVAMLSGPSQEATTRLWLTWALGCAGGLASFAIVAWRAEVDPAIAWPAATLAGIATAVLVGFSEATAEDTANQASGDSGDPHAEPSRRPLVPAGGVRSAVTLALAAATLALHAWQMDAGWYQPTRIVVGSLYVIVVPGWHLSSLFDGSRLDLIERTTLAVVLSLVAVPLGLMWVNFLGGRIDFWSIWTLVLALAVLSALLRRASLVLSGAVREEGRGRGGLLALWCSRSVSEQAVLLSVMLWLLAVGGLATRVGL